MSAPTGKNAESNDQHQHCENDRLLENKTWKPHMSCEEYLKNWKDCKSFLGRFHHYYVYGDRQDCLPLKLGYKCCIQWEQQLSLEAKGKLEELQKEEEMRRTRYPPLWEFRTHPPENWNDPKQQSSADRPIVT